MLSLLFIHFNKQSLRARLLAGILVLAIIIIFLLTAFFRLFLYDPLAGYASKKTFFYLHLNLDSQGNYYQTKILDSVLTNFQLIDFDRHQIKEELAVVCNQQTPNNCYLILVADNRKITEQYLKAKKIAYQTAGFNTLIISQSANNSQTLKKAWSPMIYWQYHSGLLKDDLTLVLNQTTKPQSFNQKLLAFLRPGIRLSGKIKNQGIVLKPLSFTATKADWQSDYLNINQPEFDILINLSANNQLNPIFTGYLNTVSKNQAGDSLNGLIKGGLTLAMKKINSTNELLTDYQIFISAPAQSEAKNAAAIKAIIGELAARLLPTEKNMYLNDGTKVTLLSVNTNLNASQSEQNYQLPIKGDLVMFVNSSSSGLAIGNNLNFQPKLAVTEDNFGLIKISSLPTNNALKQYLSDFSFVYFDENKVIIK